MPVIKASHAIWQFGRGNVPVAIPDDACLISLYPFDSVTSEFLIAERTFRTSIRSSIVLRRDLSLKIQLTWYLNVSATRGANVKRNHSMECNENVPAEERESLRIFFIGTILG